MKRASVHQTEGRLQARWLRRAVHGACWGTRRRDLTTDPRSEKAATVCHILAAHHGMDIMIDAHIVDVHNLYY